MGFMSRYAGVDRVYVTEDREFWADLRLSMPRETYEQAQSILMTLPSVSVDPASGRQTMPDTRINVPQYEDFLLTSQIAEWNLTDEADLLLPISVESIKALPDEVFAHLNREAKELRRTRNTAEAARFPDRSGVIVPNGVPAAAGLGADTDAPLVLDQSRVDGGGGL